MANTFTLTSKTYDGRYMQLTCTQTINIASNTSTISWKLETIGGDDNYYYTGPTTLTIDGKQAYYLARTGEHKFPCAKGSTSGEVTIAHNNDGSKAISVSFSTAIYTKTVSTYSDTWELDAIPRGATITSAPTSFNDEENPTISYSNPAGAAIEACISLDGTTALIGYKSLAASSTSYTFALTDAERRLLRYNTTGGNNRNVYFILKTTIGTNVFTDVKKSGLTIINATPDMVFTVLDINPDTVALTGNSSRFIKGHSTASYTLTATAKKGATISKYYATNGEDRQEGATGTMFNVQSGTFAYSVIDSRGNAPREEVTKTFVEYVDITCSQTMKIELQGETGAQITVTAQGNFFKGSFGSVTNELYLEARYKEDSGSYGAWFSLLEAGTPTYSGNTYKHTVTFTVANYDSTYTVEVRARDKLTSDTTTPYTITLKPVFDWGADSFNFNVPVSINGVTMDYIVEQGSKNSWYYRKWNSGALECWRRLQITTNVSNAWGSLYTSGALSATNLTYPVAFTEAPILSVSLMPFGTGGLIMATGNSYGSATATGSYEIARGTTVSNGQFLISYHAYGRYK